MQTATDVIERLRSVLGVTSYSEIAEKLGVSKSTVGGWVHRETVPYAECARVALEYDVSLDWLLLGRTSHDKVTKQMEHSAQQADWTADEFRALARVSGYEKLWSILRELENGARTSVGLKTLTGIAEEWLYGYLLLLERQGLVIRDGMNWALSSTGAIVIRSKDPEDLAALAVNAVEFLLHDVVPGALDAAGALILTEVRVPGKNVYGLLREKLKESLLSVDANEGTVVRLLIGMAPEKKAS